ncbi:intracellular protein transport protein USO1-like [Durio zibethinus]|uniref:Intracellular protein transport protein USO1-like n=1 Tax=Durio zibethinus TaxID=66656 RepID=A0A6P6BD42_DURZI|nr:intracellular protein transport protein USO1-like [Durio zibethinus]
MGQLEEESTRMKEQSTAKERDKAADELKGMKLTQEANKRSSPMASGKVADIHTELAAVKDALTGAIEELKNKERYIESLKIEVGKAKELEVKLAEKEASFCKLKEELIKVQSFESEAMDLLSEGKKRIHELEEEFEKGKESEKKIYDAFVAQTKEFEQTKVSLEESRQEIKSLLENLEKLEGSSEAASQSSVGDDHSLIDSLESELQLAKENLARAVEDEKVSSLKAKSLAEEVSLLKNELKSTAEAEENNKKAMDGLALALKEVITEANQTKEKLSSTKDELEKTKGEVENLKVKLKNVEEKYNEAKKEADRFKNTSERLRLEAEETLLAWNGKETGFVQCIKKAEYERNAAQEQSKTLLESLKEAENMYNKAKEENKKLRDIVKQAINEASVAKEAASIAREENSQLKDALSKKDEALNFLSQENENLKINEAAAFDNIRELKLLFCEATATTTTKEWETDEQDQGKKQKPLSSADKEHKDDKEHTKKPKHHKSSSTCLSLKFPHYKHKEAEEEPKIPLKESDEDSDSDCSDPLRGSIFDVAETPNAAAVATHQRKKSSSFLTDDETINGEDFDHLDTGHFDDEGDRSTRKKRALLRRFGDLIRGRSFPKKEQPLE